MHYGTEMKALDFGVKRSKVKVTAELPMLETELMDGVIQYSALRVSDFILVLFHLTGNFMQADK